MKAFLLAWLSCGLLQCTGFSAELPRSEYAGHELVLRDWLIIGWFQARPRLEAMEIDFLLQATGTSEPNFSTITPDTCSDRRLVQRYQARSDGIVDFERLFDKNIRYRLAPFAASFGLNSEFELHTASF